MTQRNEQPAGSDRTPQIKTFLTKVRTVSYPVPRFARITFGGGDLEDYASLGPGEFVYVLLPPVGRSDLTVDREFTWDQFKNMPERYRPRGAYYTVREHRPEEAELDLDFLLHSEDEERNAPAPDDAALENSASRWAARAKPGDPAALWGPRITYEPPSGTGWQLLVADETGLPAVAAILRHLPEGARAGAIIQVADESEEQRLDSAGEVEITWLHHGGTPAGPDSPLVEAIRTLRFPESVPKEAVYVWGAAESASVTALRRHLRNERGFEAEALSLTPYWRQTDRQSARQATKEDTSTNDPGRSR